MPHETVDPANPTRRRPADGRGKYVDDSNNPDLQLPNRRPNTSSLMSEKLLRPPSLPRRAIFWAEMTPAGAEPKVGGAGPAARVRAQDGGLRGTSRPRGPGYLEASSGAKLTDP